MRVFFSILSALCAVATLSINANSTKLINWRAFHVPHLFIKVEEQFGEGLIDKIRLLIDTGMPTTRTILSRQSHGRASKHYINESQ